MEKVAASAADVEVPLEPTGPAVAEHERRVFCFRQALSIQSAIWARLYYTNAAYEVDSCSELDVTLQTFIIVQVAKRVAIQRWMERRP